MKVLAYNLPGYHRIPENDKWWGEGFTEWDNVRSGRPLFKGHEQPMIPLNNEYYDLSKEEDVVKQAKLAKDFGIYGFIYYHYWFNGKKLLEKPIEIYRDSEGCDLKYCFCWANEPWCRTWDGNEKEVLMPQDYGTEEDWEAHLQYLLSFFQDERYIKHNGDPMLLIYSVARIPHFDDMIEYWNSRIKNYGYKEIYLVETVSPLSNGAYSKYSKAVTEFEPMYSMRCEIGLKTKIKRFTSKLFKLGERLDYDEIWNLILKRNRDYSGRSIIQGAFVNWDNSPRKGKKGIVFVGGTPSKFGTYLSKLCKTKRKNVSNEYVIINAWNEWGEGAMLEPTQQHGYEYLNEVKKIV